MSSAWQGSGSRLSLGLASGGPRAWLGEPGAGVPGAQGWALVSLGMLSDYARCWCRKQPRELDCQPLNTLDSAAPVWP